MGLRDLYNGLEDKWYKALDKINASIPIYKIVEPVDRVVPSFILFLAVIAALVAFFLAAPLLPSGQQAAVTVTVEDETGDLLQGVTVNYTIAGIVNSKQTNADGQIKFNAPFDSSVGIRIDETTVEGVEYEAGVKSIEVGAEPSVSEKIVLMKKEPPYVERTILFQNAAGERITGKEIKVRLSCQNPLTTPDPLEVTDLDADGAITVREPRDCIVFQATIITPSEFKQRSYIIQNGTEIVLLESLDAAKGALRVRVKDSAGKLVEETNFAVQLLDLDGAVVEERYTLNYGEAIFPSVTVGNYSLSVEDSTGDYALATLDSVPVSVDETNAVDVIVSKTVKATINVSVVDKDSGQGIANAGVRLVDASNRILSEKSTGDDAEEVTFYLTEGGNYTLFAMHDEYLYEEVTLQDVLDADITIELERLTAVNSGRIEVKVVDEDDIAVKNAKVKLRFLDSGMLAPYSPKFTDVNGVAAFSGVKAGSYYAYVEKFPAYGDNKEQGREIDIREVSYFTVQLFIGNSMIEVRAVDEDMLPVHEAEAEFFSEAGESLGKIPLPEGIGQYELKADKRVYVVVSHADYQAVQTMPKQLWPDQLIGFEATLEPRLILGNPAIRFEGIFDSAGNMVQQLNAGNKYIVKFRLSIPEAADFRRGGFHFRVGDERFLENDPLVIKDIIAGDIGAPLKGTSFTPPLGYEEDSRNITMGDAKWVNISWRDLEPRNYFFGFEARVKSQITPYTGLTMHYRAWAVDSDGYYVRAPEDETLGSAETVAVKEALYAKTYDLQFLEGSPADCQEDFCYSGESILDEDRGLYIYEPYRMRSGVPYKFTFAILNNSERRYENSELYITAVGLTITGYKIQNASAQEIAAQGISVKKIEAIDLGEFTKGKSSSAEVRFTATKLGNASIEVKVVADGRVVFLRTVGTHVTSDKEMQLDVSPQLLPAYLQQDITVSAKDATAGWGAEISDALVRVTVSNPDKTEFVYTDMTNGFGVAEFSLPALSPNTRVSVEAEKPGYYAEPVIMFVDGNVLRFSPNSVKANLDTRGAKEQLFVVDVENLIAKDVKIEAIGLSGRFKGLLDTQTMLNFTKQHIGTTIAAMDSESLQLFKAVLGPNAEEMLLKSERLEGEYLITALQPETGVSWDFVIPLEADVRLGGLPENAPCISITQKEWIAATQGNRASVEFEVQNNCMSGNRFIELENLQAKLGWLGDAIGTVELTVTEAETGASNTAVLRSLVWSKLFDRVKAEGTYYAVLTFTPKHGHIGERAEFEVIIDGEVVTDSGPAFVGASPSSIKAEIDVINLDQCIQYPGAENVVEMSESQDSATFQIDTSQCGQTSVEIYLCYQDSGCKGGALEGGIGVIPEHFTLTSEQSTREVRVERQSVPGMYGVTVFARVPGSSYREVHVVDVLVKPTADNAFSLDKYAFTILGAGSKDSAVLTNTEVEEQVNVRASVCAWKEAEEKGSFSMTGALIGGLATQAILLPMEIATGPVIMGEIAFCPVCIPIIAIGAIVGGLLGGLFGEDPCEEYITRPLPDWVMNLEKDAGSIAPDNPLIGAAWSMKNMKMLGKNEKQEVGIVFENLGIEDTKPTYSTVKVSATKHIHANPTNYGKSSNFGPYNVKDAKRITYTQLFHLKFETKVAEQEIPPVSYDTYECTQGTLIGRTGPGALPRIKLNWRWDDIAGIPANACDYDNQGYIYCDATQFSIELSKRLYTFGEFLGVNKDNLVCPTNPLTKTVLEFNKQYGTREVKNGHIGLRQVGGTISSADLEVSFEVMNDTVSTQTAGITVELTPPEGVSIPAEKRKCFRELDISAQQSKKGKCEFKDLSVSDNYYGMSIDINSSTTLFVDTNGFYGSFKILEPVDLGCWLAKSTTLLDGKPAIEYFLDEAEDIAWTPGIIDREALRKLLHFKAYLMKDSYSEDFQKDFADFYITKGFYNAPAWFADDPGGKFADYFADRFYLNFTRRYVDSDQLPNAGLYDIVLDIDFISGDWELFDVYGEPNAKIDVEFYLTKAAYPNSIFYYLPFNGNVGAESADGRQGYGVNYENFDDPVLVLGTGDLVETGEIYGSTPAMRLNTEVVEDFKQINATAANRGFLLSIEESSEVNQRDLAFYPNYATPAVLKMSHTKTDKPFAAFYELRESGSPLETGSNLTFWEGMGQCLDYTGVPVVEAFDFKPDREAIKEDNLPNWQFTYAADWPKADYAGDVYLKTVFYTPISRVYTLKSIQPEELRFIAPNSIESQSVELNGIMGMPHNSVFAQASVNSIQDVFDLTEAGHVCVINTGTRTAFWWNPKTLYETRGDRTSIKDLEMSLVAGQNCIGFGS